MLQSRIKSFKNAIKGILLASESELNFKIHIVASIIVVVMGMLFDIEKSEWLTLILTITLVLVVELVNTAIEYLCDHVHPDQHPNIAKVKDVAAGAVLVSASGAMMIGLIIFEPHISQLLMDSI